MYPQVPVISVGPSLAVEMRGAISEVGVGSVWTVKERELRCHITTDLQSGQALFCIKNTFFSISAFFLADQHGRVGDSCAVMAVNITPKSLH